MTKAQARKKVSAAVMATDVAQEKIREAIRKHHTIISINSVGVYMDPGEVKQHLLEMTEELQRARQILADTEWPTDRDYDLAGY